MSPIPYMQMHALPFLPAGSLRFVSMACNALPMTIFALVSLYASSVFYSSAINLSICDVTAHIGWQ